MKKERIEEKTNKQANEKQIKPNPKPEQNLFQNYSKSTKVTPMFPKVLKVKMGQKIPQCLLIFVSLK